MRRRLIGHLLIAGGIFSLVLAAMLPTVVYPRLALVPSDPQATQRLTGSGFTVYMANKLKQFTNQNIDTRLYVREDDRKPADPADNAHWRVATVVNVEGLGLLQATIEGISVNRHTALANNCCGDYLITKENDTTGMPVTHSGYTFKFPFNTQRQDYQVWDANALRAYPARFVGDGTRRGLHVYRFVQDVPDQKVGTQELPGKDIGFPDQPSVTTDFMYRVQRVYWVEPNSGAVVDYSETDDRRLAYQGHQLGVFQGTMHTVPTPNDETFKTVQVAAATLPWIRGKLSWVLAPLGITNVLLGLLLLRGTGGRREKDEWDDEWDDDGDEWEDEEEDDDDEWGDLPPRRRELASSSRRRR